MASVSSELDFYGWIHHNIALLKDRKLTEIDVDQLIDELESMAKRDKYELINHLLILIAHLLKWQFQFNQLNELYQNFRGASWRATIAEQRKQLAKQLKCSPSLKAFLLPAIEEAYGDAVDLAVKETGLATKTFPQKCPYSIEQLLDEEFYPHE